MASAKIVLSNSVPVGYRFHPTDEEIVSHFLKNKMLGNDHLVQAIPEVDFCQFEPWELPKFSVVESDDPEWFFFSTRDFKHCNGRQLNRKTRDGFWKATGRDRKIKARRTKNLIGMKKTLVFHKGRGPNAVRTNWVMHEYHSVDNYPQRTMYLVCRLKKKDDDKVDKSANDNVDSGLESRTIERAISEAWPDENGGLPSTLALEEADIELLCPGDHLNWEEEIEVNEFVNSVIVDGEEYYEEETNNPLHNHFLQSQWAGSTPLEEAMLSTDTDFEATRSLFGDLPPNSSAIGEGSSWSVQPQIMLRKESGSMLLSKHLRYKVQDNIYRCNEFSGQANSGRAVSRIRLQQRIGNTAGNPIKAEEASKYTSNDHPKESEIGTRPPSEYFAHVIIGIVLFIVIVREMVLYGEWGM